MVWFTTDGDRTHGHGLVKTLDGTDKTRVRVTILLPNRDVHKWGEWAARRGIDPQWRRGLIEESGGGAGT